MKKVIMNRVYDTSRAKRLAVVNVKGTQITELYRKRTGEFFLFCGYSDGNQTIEPLSYNEACAWAGRFMSADEYEKIFGKIGNERVVTSISISGEAYKKLKQLASDNKVSMSEIIEKIIFKNA